MSISRTNLNLKAVNIIGDLIICDMYVTEGFFTNFINYLNGLYLFLFNSLFNVSFMIESSYIRVQIYYL